MTEHGCQWEITVPGPHPGCAEFAPPETFGCPEPATTVAFFAASPYEPVGTTVLFCGFHAATETAEATIAISECPMTCVGCGEPVWAVHVAQHAVGQPCPTCQQPAAEHPGCSCPEQAAWEAAMAEHEASV